MRSGKDLHTRKARFHWLRCVSRALSSGNNAENIMLFTSEITNTAKREAAYAYLQSNEDGANIFAAQCVPGAIVKLGPVKKQAGRITFEVRGAGGGMLVPFTVTIAAGMPEAEVWSTWFCTLDKASLTVLTDPTYESFIFSESDRL